MNPDVSVAEFGVGPRNVKVSPNPFTESTLLKFDNKTNETLTLVVYDVLGQIVREFKNISTDKVIIQRKNLSAETYYYQFMGESGSDTGQFIVE